MSERERLDVALSKQNGISRETAKALIKNGKIIVNGRRETKPSTLIFPRDTLYITEKMKYVSRGGDKLEKAIRYFNIDLKGKICIDVGASTGGFTDCMLCHGAERVYAIDVGHSQMADSLKNDKRVISFEKTNVKNIPKGIIGETVYFAAVDVSFISLGKILGSLYELFSHSAVLLVKPQFEAGRNISIKHMNVHEKVLRNVADVAVSSGFSVLGLTVSPIKGGAGNIEYLLHIGKLDNVNNICINSVVREAFGRAEGN